MGKLIALFLAFSVLGIISGTLVSCQTPALERFPKVHEGMAKDEILDLLGFFNRTEYKAGKEKWAYKFYPNRHSSHQELRFVTFVNGQVVAFGEDTDELKRLREMKESDE
jgi:hypothetical protein